MSTPRTAHSCTPTYDVIKDHLADGAAVTVVLFNHLPLDYDAPALSPWAFIAFKHHKKYAEERDRFINEKKRKVETFQREWEEQLMIAKMNIEKPKISLLRKVMASLLVLDDTITSTFMEEWDLIKNLGILDNNVPDESQQEEICNFYTKYFVEPAQRYVQDEFM